MAGSREPLGITSNRPCTRLYVACDGPSPERSGESEKVAATRAVIDIEIDWPCQIERLYSDVNQGCRLGVSQGLLEVCPGKACPGVAPTVV